MKTVINFTDKILFCLIFKHYFIRIVHNTAKTTSGTNIKILKEWNSIL